MMNLPCSWEILLLCLWMQVDIVTGIYLQDGTGNPLSKEDVLLLKDEEDPKCFTRTEQDFTCFFETPDNNRTYDLLYRVEGSLPREKRCEMSVQKTEKGTFLHVCYFPVRDIFFFVVTHLEVVEHNTNTSLYRRTISVEDHFLLDPPFNVSLNHNAKPGQLQVSWHSVVPTYCKNEEMYQIKYFSKGKQEKIEEEAREECLLDQLVPGEEVQVQVRVKCAYYSKAGHWSSWSQPVRAVVPQSADDVSLMCFTSDLEYFTCEWNGSRSDSQNEYKVSYQMSISDALGWTDWTECLTDWDLIDQCRFYGDQSRGVRVKFTSAAAPLSRTFYTDEFTLKKSIKTFPPSHVKAVLREDKLCLRWGAPLVSLSAHLQYEVGYQIRESEDWMTRLLNGPETSTCLGVPFGRHFSVKLRAKPDGSIYSGLWSDWSDVLTGDTPTDRDLLLIVFVPVSVLMSAVLLIFIFYSYHRRLKQYFWPPLPNLDKVLQGYLTEINGQKWDPPITAKQCTEETTSSLVEIMFADEISGPEKPSGESTQLLRSSESDLPDLKQTNEKHKSEEFPDYVTLNKDSVILCPKGNKNVYEQIGEKERLVMEKELLQKCQSPCSESAFIPACQGTNFLNHSYLAVAEPAERFDSEVTAVRGSGNIYTNLPCG